MEYQVRIEINFHTTAQAQAFMCRLDGTDGDVLLAIEEAVFEHCGFARLPDEPDAMSDRAWVDIDPHDRERFEEDVLAVNLCR